MPSWTTVAATNIGDAKAESVATVDIRVGTTDSRFVGPVILQRFGNEALFRIAVLQDGADRNALAICLPPDEIWTAEPPKKVISPHSKTKAIKSIINLPENNAEGFDKVTIVMPWNGNDGPSFLFSEAVVFASQVVVDAVLSTKEDGCENSNNEGSKHEESNYAASSDESDFSDLDISGLQVSSP
ncbi:hypothetical protein SEMRO_31_G020510.1 [Seminavis robusta]|uniref:Uncharacterized protein n=1 Tax=Seminavis robusta TaxID=568900 RepID=A0A9N8DA71_9STRA|nr:hypothetical protein SEMRO_31_G020510.1 [Seminavis robusta]|eukprot:Sro31_g020510.1 n/a (185) ;mRNA; r:147550-148104